MLDTGDYSPDINVETWIANHHDFDFEQRCVMALFHGATYAGPCESMIATLFPKLTPQTIPKVIEFFEANKKRLLFSPDCKYRKMVFPKFLGSIGRSLVPFGSLGNFISSAFEGKPQTNYRNLQAMAFQSWYHWGRMGHWCFAEALLHFTKAPIQPPTMEFYINSSHRAGWAYALNRDDLAGEKLSVHDCAWLEGKATDYVRTLGLNNTAFLSLETACCNYKRQHHGTRYGGCYIDEQHDEIRTMQVKWPERAELWDDYLAGRQAVLPADLLYENFNDTGLAYRKEMCRALVDHGRMPRVEAWLTGKPQQWN
jgi:hypothetical protein